MNRTLLKNLLISAIILNVLAVGELFAQQPATTPMVKRNSPFSPNPKKKAESEQTSPNEADKTKDSLNEGKIVKVEATKTSGETTTSEKGNETAAEPKNDGNEEFQSRSVAAKTLEVAKKASAVTPSPTELYKVGIGDILFISLQNAPSKESTYFTVLKDGTIDYPLAGEMVQVLGLTTEQIEDLLKEKIKLYENPQVSVKIREHNSHIFNVLGLVEKSGEKTMQREAIPLYVVRAEAVVQSRANQVIIKRSGVETQTLDLKDSKTGDVLIFPGDIVEFNAGEINTTIVAQFYFIGGGIISGGRKEYTQGLTLTQAILESGGLRKPNTRKIIIRRKNEAGLLVTKDFDLKAIKDGKIADPVLMAGDTIEIEN